MIGCLIGSSVEEPYPEEKGGEPGEKIEHSRSCVILHSEICPYGGDVEEVTLRAKTNRGRSKDQL